MLLYKSYAAILKHLLTTMYRKTNEHEHTMMKWKQKKNPETKEKEKEKKTKKKENDDEVWRQQTVAQIANGWMQ